MLNPHRPEQDYYLILTGWGPCRVFIVAGIGIGTKQRRSKLVDKINCFVIDDICYGLILFLKKTLYGMEKAMQAVRILYICCQSYFLL